MKNIKTGFQPLLKKATKLRIESKLESAKEIYEEIVDFYPEKSQGFVGLAQIASSQKDFGKALLYWEKLIQSFQNQVPNRPGWFLACAHAYSELEQYSNAVVCMKKSLTVLHEEQKSPIIPQLYNTLLKAGRKLEAQVLLDNSLLQYSGHVQLIIVAARRAHVNKNYQSALKLWEKAIRLLDGESKQATILYANTVVGKAIALHALWRSCEARQVLLILIQDVPSFLPAKNWLITIETFLANWESALTYCHDNSAKGLEQKGKILIHLARYQEAEALVEQLLLLFPDNINGTRLQLAVLTAQKLNNLVDQVIDVSLNKFPNDIEFLDIKAQSLLLDGDVYNTDKILNQLEAITKHKNATYWTHTLVNHGWSAFKKEIREELNNKLSISEKLNADLIRLYLKRNEIPNLLIGDLCVTLNSFPYQLPFFLLYIQSLIAEKYFYFAIMLIDSLPPEYTVKNNVAPYLSWAKAIQGQWIEAKTAVNSCYEKYPPRAFVAPIKQLEIDSKSTLRKCSEGVIAFLPVLDEMHNLPHFFRHHRKIGVATFVVIDNGSTDGSIEFLRAQPDVLLYRTSDNFNLAVSSMRWVNELQVRHGQNGWRLFLDADECFIYPDWERRDLNILCQSLDDEGAEGYSAYMMDVYPKCFESSWSYSTARTNSVFFDNNYLIMDELNAPYQCIQGGVRERLYNRSRREIQSKIPLTKGSQVPIYLGNHVSVPIIMSSGNGVLLHYKLADLWRRGEKTVVNQDAQYTQRGKDCQGRYKSYFSNYELLLAPSLLDEGLSVKLGDSRELVALGRMSDEGIGKKYFTVPNYNLDVITRHPILKCYESKAAGSAGEFSFVPDKGDIVDSKTASQSSILFCAALFRGKVLYTEQVYAGDETEASNHRIPQLKSPQFLFEVPYSKIDEMHSGLSPRLTYIFSIDCCGFAVLHEALDIINLPCVSEPHMTAQVKSRRDEIVYAFDEDAPVKLIQAMTRSLAAHNEEDLVIKLGSQSNLLVNDILQAHPDLKAIFMLRQWRSWVLSCHVAFDESGDNLALKLREVILAYHRLVECKAAPLLIWYDDLSEGPSVILDKMGLKLNQKQHDAVIKANAQIETLVGTQEQQSLGQMEPEEVEKLFNSFLDSWSFSKPDCLSLYPDVYKGLGIPG